MYGGKEIITLHETNYSGHAQKHGNKLSVYFVVFAFLYRFTTT
jgi:hypothetical protein